ncbi:facilitated trehalose transporter Tret1-2 homolog [Homalodisca vitripennis]|uniref:facilitated trehalose transporter Tret1-2 homolog n=1 Tax=Homalodisca vitripennis TaxID=197043 RepID=UPI001EEB40A6|nr:facilitated trehalose transporter Tret1-2 homolog [Homalodisca vitripennis]
MKLSEPMLVSTGGWGGGVLNQYVAAVSGSMCYTIMGSATAWPSPVLIKMADGETPMVLDVPQVSWMVSLMFLGHITSPLPTGYLMDIFGRKRTCLCLTILPFTSWLLIFFANSPVHLYIARFTAGLWIGVTTTVMPIYVGEISGPRLRNSLTTINNLLLNFGVLFAYVIGPFVSYYTLAIACEALTVLYFLAFFSMPESPYFYMKHKQREKALEVLSWLRKGETEENIEAEIKRIEQAIEEQTLQKGTLKDIFFDRGNRKAFLISIIYAILKRMSGSGVMQAYTSVTLPKVTFGVLDPNTCVIVIGTISLLSSLASTALAVRYRRMTLLTISCIGCAISTAIIMIWFYLDELTSTKVTAYSDIVFISFALYYSVFNIGLGPVGTSIKGEIFSTNVKALSSSLTTLVVAFSGFIMNKFYLLIDQWLGMYFNYLIFSVACTVALAFTWTYVPDTQNKTLEEIQELLRGGGKKYRNYDSTEPLSKT